MSERVQKDREIVSITNRHIDNALLILDLRTTTLEIAHKALKIEIDGIAADPTLLDSTIAGTIQRNYHRAEMILADGIVNQVIWDKIIEEVTILVIILDITVGNVSQTVFSSDTIKITNSL